MQALYSLGTLARMGNVSVDRLRRVLRSSGVTLLRGFDATAGTLTPVTGAGAMVTVPAASFVGIAALP